MNEGSHHSLQKKLISINLHEIYFKISLKIKSKEIDNPINTKPLKSNFLFTPQSSSFGKYLYNAITAKPANGTCEYSHAS